MSKSEITRKARFWPELPHEEVRFPSPPSPPSPPNSTTLISVFISGIGFFVMAIAFIIFNQGSTPGFSLVFIGISAITSLGTIITFRIQKNKYVQQISLLRGKYQSAIEVSEKRVCELQKKEAAARYEIDPPLFNFEEENALLGGETITHRTFDDQDLFLWARSPKDPDFLSSRVGLGPCAVTYKIKQEESNATITLPTPFEAEHQRATNISKQYSKVIAPITISLATKGPVTIVADNNLFGSLERAREIARVIVSQIAYHHSPQDVRILIFAPESQRTQWEWSAKLPHTLFWGKNDFETFLTIPDDISSYSLDEIVSLSPAVCTNPRITDAFLSQLSREMGRREILIDGSHSPIIPTFLPHLVVVIDDYEAETKNFTAEKMRSNVSNSQNNEPPIKRSELVLAMSRGNELGVSLLCVCAQRASVPSTSTTLVDLSGLKSISQRPKISQVYPLSNQSRTLPGPTIPVVEPTQPISFVESSSEKTIQALVRSLHIDPKPALECYKLDQAPVDKLTILAQKLNNVMPKDMKRPQIRTQVDLRSLYNPSIDLQTFDPFKMWRDTSRSQTSLRGGVSESMSLPIPIGMKIGDETQYLDFVLDGPHGILIGQTGSGKSEMLQTIITALAIGYPPSEVTFLLIDYKAGLALEPFKELPHTVGFLSNVSSSAQIQRFITMLRFEAIRRELEVKKGILPPRLFIIIDEFAEMAKRTETVLDEIFTITRIGRQLNMHLLLSAQRPEGIIGTKVRDFVQYRICLRCASNEDSREVIGRIDAANLPSNIPGRGYLLHGDNQLELFQSARVAIFI